MMSKKYRIIGDIHARVNWHQLIEPFDENTTYIFLGDYTDPYYGWENVSYDQMIEEINKMFNFKREHPDNVVLLYGNHDIQYVIGMGDTNRYDRLNVDDISKLFEDNKDLFHGIAYHVSEKYLITHAGVTFDWYTSRCEFDKDNIGKEPLEDVCKHINDVWEKNKTLFTFRANTYSYYDYCGDDKHHSPVWVRPNALWESNLFGFDSGKIQIIGHTPYDGTLDKNPNETTNRVATFGTLKTPATDEEIDSGIYLLSSMDKCCLVTNDPEHVDIIDVDCLRRETACVDIDEDTLEWKKFSLGNDIIDVKKLI